MTKREAKREACAFTADMLVNLDAWEERYPDKSDKDIAKIIQAFKHLEDELRKRGGEK